MIFNSTKEFEVLLLKDRFTKDNRTSSGWADALLNGRFLGQNTHVVEIQLHHDKLVSIREDMGGHYLYSIFRSLVEALEVVYGNEDAQKKIAKHAPRLVDESIIDQLQAEIHANKIEIDARNSEISTKNSEIEKLQAEIEAMKTELYTKNSENRKLQSDNTVMKADSQKLTEEMHKLRNQENEVCLTNISSVS